MVRRGNAAFGMAEKLSVPSMMKYIVVFALLTLATSCGVHQNFKRSYLLSPGMTKAEVEAIMGKPVKSDFRDYVEEWHYCKTGVTVDELIALFFYEGKLVEKLNYTVTLTDAAGSYGSCEKFVRMGNYRVPDKVIEIRTR